MLTLASLLLLLPSNPASASEGLFAYTYTAETTPSGEWEFEQKNTLRTGKARGEYTSLDLRTELEYGITDRLQGSLYLNSSYLHSRNQYDPEDVSKDLPNFDDYKINGTSLELMYRILSPYSDGFGLAVYLEPELSVRDHMTGQDRIERALEFRLILQKNFFDDQLITAANFMLEPEWEREDSKTVRELWYQGSLGVTYRVAANWFVGAELRNHREFPNMAINTQEHSAWFAGPTLHYGSEGWWGTLSVLPQIGGVPNNLGTGSDGLPVQNPKLHLGQHEKLEVSFNVGIPIGAGHTHH